MLARAIRGAGVLRVVGQAEEAEGRAQRQREAAGAAEQQLHQLKMQVHRPAACRILSESILEGALCFLNVWKAKCLNLPIVIRAHAPRQASLLAPRGGGDPRD